MHACTHAHVNLLVFINSLQTYNQNCSHRRLFARVYACVCRQKQSRKLWTKNLPPIGTALLARCASLVFKRLSVVCVYNSVCHSAITMCMASTHVYASVYCTCVHPHLHLCMNSYTRTRKHLSLYLTLSCPHARTHSTRTRTCTRTRTHINAHTHKCTRIHAHTLTHIHTSSHTRAP